LGTGLENVKNQQNAINQKRASLILLMQKVGVRVHGQKQKNQKNNAQLREKKLVVKNNIN
tara:strand:+ start:15 stop:194 length:180 start_codon:yes stop_codon:yes gene_type:complete